MTKIIFACPRCSQRLRADADRTDEQITCPGCEHVFIPDTDCKRPEREDESEEILQAEKLEYASESLRQIAFVTICAFLLCIGGAIYARIEESPAWLPWCWGASAALGLSIILWFASQIIAIRANGLRILEGIQK